ncbi:MAG: hypothetical protein COV52_07610 [Gammaproteobacteria bacterium CG11_big_fil_rev_8_21_14_0_20_46_22]|nr:MAG: hypothetical protein COW05_06850 [Gammaproteobacteria bacterium CG12_big_fil_rev_8_21_14_0_65_46_12]PIR10746.1 MAG: hypothetical protein COV52_07610 [Gammaproteobacteria bacterium CG11_big_fil_rev_8_21_14_0_20_46_22]
MEKVITLAGALALGLAGATAVAGNAGQANQHGFYAEAMAGGNYLQDQYLYDQTAGIGGDASYKLGWNAQLAAGYRFTQHWRTAFAVTYLRNSTDKVTSTNNGQLNGGHASAWTYMLNGYYDITTGTALTPYFGLGLGAARVSTDYHYDGNYDHTDTAFAYQGILGLSYNVKHNVSVFGEFRHIGTAKIESKYEGQKVEGYYQNNLLDIGIRYLF